MTKKENPFSASSAWLSDSYLSLGILGFFLFVLLGITSLPSVSNTVTWREFRFVQVTALRFHYNIAECTWLCKHPNFCYVMTNFFFILLQYFPSNLIFLNNS